MDVWMVDSRQTGRSWSGWLPRKRSILQALDRSWGHTGATYLGHGVAVHANGGHALAHGAHRHDAAEALRLLEDSGGRAVAAVPPRMALEVPSTASSSCSALSAGSSAWVPGRCCSSASPPSCSTPGDNRGGSGLLGRPTSLSHPCSQQWQAPSKAELLN